MAGIRQVPVVRNNLSNVDLLVEKSGNIFMFVSKLKQY